MKRRSALTAAAVLSGVGIALAEDDTSSLTIATDGATVNWWKPVRRICKFHGEHGDYYLLNNNSYCLICIGDMFDNAIGRMEVVE